MLLRRVSLALLLSSAAILAAAAEEDDVDRTDFSDPALSSDLDKKKPLAPHDDVEPSSMIVQPIGENLPIGAASYLLVSLANLGPKMFNVTKINGIVQDVKTGEKLANFTRRMYGDPLGPREQRSFRYPFVPSKKLSPGEYRLVFSAFYNNRDKEPFSTVVYNETNVLVPGPREPVPMPDMGTVAMGAAAVLLAVFAYTSFSGSSGSKAPKDSTKPTEPAQWLPANTDVVGAASPGKKKKAASKRA